MTTMTESDADLTALLLAATERCERASARMQELTWKAQNVRAELDAALREFQVAIDQLDRAMGTAPAETPMQVVDATGLAIARLGWDRLYGAGRCEATEHEARRGRRP